jgi:hypothetical protein
VDRKITQTYKHINRSQQRKKEAKKRNTIITTNSTFDLANYCIHYAKHQNPCFTPDELIQKL